MSSYPFRDIEQKWQMIWNESCAFKAQDDSSKPKFYILEMFPYPSGKLHMGHVRNYMIGEALARFKRLQGYNVLHPMGWDAFGLPAENAAVKHKTSPAKWTIDNINVMRQQLKSLGLSYDWSREFATCWVDYYGLEQKLFLDFYRQGLAYRKESWVNWDPVDHCVLANEQVINGRGWRSNAIVEKRKLMQWSLKITDYAEELLDDLQELQEWPEKVVKMQENWIGRSEGAFVRFDIVNSNQSLHVFTTRPETLFGASFCGISPVHPLAEEWAKNDPELASFIAECQKTPTTEEALSTAEKKGYNTGFSVKHPFVEGHTIPIFVANFVLIDYGTGAIFACPAHDERDFDFATKYQLPILPVVMPAEGINHDISKEAYTGPGVMVNSSFLNGLSVPEAKKKAIERLVSLNKGDCQITYRLRDWCISRQRYWGCPIPIIHCNSCGVVPVPDQDLPVKLPEDVTFDITGNPLDHHPTWKHVSCPTCNQSAVRETDTFDTFFESSWYFLRFCSPHDSFPINKDLVQQWMPVDWYIGGIEHAVLHLLYARFFTKAVRDCGYIALSEPFKRLLTQGMICHQTFQDEDGEWLYPEEVMKVSNNQYVTVEGNRPVISGRSEKMAKSKKNLVDPNFIMETYGIDSARLFVMSDTPPDRDFDWSEEGIEGAWRYLNRLWRLSERLPKIKNRSGQKEESLKIRQNTHQAIEKIEKSYERATFNKAIAFARELTRVIEENIDNDAVSGDSLMESMTVLMLSLSPLIPHICSELWERLSLSDVPLLKTPWPKADPILAKIQDITIAVQVNGKMRGSFTASVDSDQEILVEEALKLPTVMRDLDGRSVRRSIVVPNRIVNLVV